MLRLYDYRDTGDMRAAINALTSIVSEPGVTLAPEPPSYGQRSSRRTPSAFCQGLDIRLETDPRAWSGGGLYLLASVLERFFALNATVNSFSRTRIVLRGGSETVASWPARSGTRELG